MLDRTLFFYFQIMNIVEMYNFGRVCRNWILVMTFSLGYFFSKKSSQSVNFFAPGPEKKNSILNARKKFDILW